ncbi:MAG: DUF4870 domain-containing protein [Ignavibacteria bacterium]|nr:DUF4870 domain-containing protein [Ignavibacteria bacterium]
MTDIPTQQESQQQYLTSDDRMLALVTHLSACFGGILIPIIIYFIQKDKSKFVAFNALSAIFWQLIYIGVILLLSFGFILLGVLVPTLTVATKSSEMPVLFIIFVIVLCIVIIGIVLIFLGYSIFSAIKSYQGNIVMYPIVGKIAYRKIYG